MDDKLMLVMKTSLTSMLDTSYWSVLLIAMSCNVNDRLAAQSMAALWASVAVEIVEIRQTQMLRANVNMQITFGSEAHAAAYTSPARQLAIMAEVVLAADELPLIAVNSASVDAQVTFLGETPAATWMLTLKPLSVCQC